MFYLFWPEQILFSLWFTLTGKTQLNSFVFTVLCCKFCTSLIFFPLFSINPLLKWQCFQMEVSLWDVVWSKGSCCWFWQSMLQFPEMDSIAKGQTQTSSKIIFFLIQNAGLLSGFAIILLITLFAGNINLGWGAGRPRAAAPPAATNPKKGRLYAFIPLD